MALRLIRSITELEYEDKLDNLLTKLDIVESWKHIDKDTKRVTLSILIYEEDTQAIIDKIETICGTTSDTHIIVEPIVAAVSPKIKKREKQEQKENIAKSAAIAREELKDTVVKGIRFNSTYIWLVVLSTIVAAIGLLENDITFIIGAMVIAPMLGPNLAMAFATTLGDFKLFGAAVKTNVAGIIICLVLSVIIGLIWPYGLDSHQLLMRTDLGFDIITLSLASGAAAALSLTAGLSSILVGVMVSVALLPPVTTLGIMLGSGHPRLAAGAALLFITNVVCINLSANIIFITKGIRPFRWYEKKRAKRAIYWNLIIWTLLLLVLATAIYLRHGLSFIE